jgi:hypothetical protein
MTTEQLKLITPLVRRQEAIGKKMAELKKESDALEFQIQGIVAGGQSGAEA